MAVRQLRKDYSVNQTNPFAHVIRSSSTSFFQQHHDESELLPETTSNYLINVKKQLKPTRSLSTMPDLEMDPAAQRDDRLHLDKQPKRNPFVKSNSLSNCQLSHDDQPPSRVCPVNSKPKNNIYNKRQPLRNETEEQLEDMLSNLNEIPKTTDLLTNNKFRIITRSPTPLNKMNVDLISGPSVQSTTRLVQESVPHLVSHCMMAEQQQSNLPTEHSPISLNNKPTRPTRPERTFGLIKSPTELIMNAPTKQANVLLKSRTHGNLSNEYNEPQSRSFVDRTVGLVDQVDHRKDQAKFDEQDRSKREESTRSIWPKQIKKQIKSGKQQFRTSSSIRLLPVRCLAVCVLLFCLFIYFHKNRCVKIG